MIETYKIEKYNLVFVFYHFLSHGLASAWPWPGNGQAAHAPAKGLAYRLPQGLAGKSSLPLAASRNSKQACNTLSDFPMS